MVFLKPFPRFPITSSLHKLRFLQSTRPAVRVCPTAPESPEAQNYSMARVWCHFLTYKTGFIFCLGEETDNFLVGDKQLGRRDGVLHFHPRKPDWNINPKIEVQNYSMFLFILGWILRLFGCSFSVSCPHLVLLTAQGCHLLSPGHDQ